MSGTKILWAQIIIVTSVALLFVWAATQWVAFRLGHQPQLGAPVTELFGWSVYAPWSFFVWWYWYDAYAPRVFVEGAIIAGSGGIAAIAVAIFLSVLHAREASHVTTYGSARWVSRKDVEAAGLLGEDGEVLETGMEPGSLLPLPPGADVKFSVPVEPVQYGAYVKAHLRAIAAAVGVPYEHVSGDYEGVTYSSVRAALVEFRRRVEAWQYHLVVRQFCRPVWRRFITLERLSI
jgi:hypothetical protein